MMAPSRWHRTMVGWLFVSPWLLGFIALFAFPFAISFWWSFCEFDLLTPPRYVGTANYERILAECRTGTGVGRALWNTAYFAIFSVPLSIVTGVGLAVVLHWNVRGQAIYRTLCFLPTVVPVVASSILWIALLDPQRGAVNTFLGHLQLPGPQWLQSDREFGNVPAWLMGDGGMGSKDALVLMALWGVGNFMVIYLAAIGDIPNSLYQAAELDGAGRWARFWHVTLPLLTPVILFNLIMGLIQSVQAFTQVYLVSEGTGGPNQSTLVLSLHLFLSAFQDLQMGYASAVAWVLFVVLVIMTAFLFSSSHRWVHYQGSRQR